MLTLGLALISQTNGSTTFSPRAASSSRTEAALATRTGLAQRRNARERVYVNENCNSKVSLRPKKFFDTL